MKEGRFFLRFYNKIRLLPTWIVLTMRMCHLCAGIWPGVTILTHPALHAVLAHRGSFCRPLCHFSTPQSRLTRHDTG